MFFGLIDRFHEEGASDIGKRNTRSVPGILWAKQPSDLLRVPSLGHPLGRDQNALGFSLGSAS